MSSFFFKRGDFILFKYIFYKEINFIFNVDVCLHVCM